MSKLETNTIDTVSGTTTLQIGSTNTNTITLGTSGDTITVPSGASLSVPSGGLSGQNYPAFQAYQGSSQTISNTTNTKAEIDTEEFDTDNCYNTSTYRFTPTVAGKYFVYAQLSLYGASDVDLARTQIYKNGSLFVRGDVDPVNSYPQNRNTVKVSYTIDMNGSTDYVEVFGLLTTSATRTIENGLNSHFGAYRIGA